MSISSKYLVLTSGQFNILLHLQKLLIRDDIFRTAAKDQGLYQKKDAWLKDWVHSLAESHKQGVTGIENELTEREVANELLKEQVHIRALIVLEAFSFVPYFPLSARGSGVPKNVYTKELRDAWEAKLMSFLLLLNFDLQRFSLIKKVHSEAVKEIPGTDWKSIKRKASIIVAASALLGVTGGLAAPWIGGIIGTTFLGLSGAAATSAGLALLGGGAIAAGGGGMALGTAFIVGGGALFGSLVGYGVSDKAGGVNQAELLAFDTNFLISQAAKVETLAKVCVEREEVDEFVRDVIKSYRENIEKLEEIIKLRDQLKNVYPNLKMETVERNRRILENALKRIREIV